MVPLLFDVFYANSFGPTARAVQAAMQANPAKPGLALPRKPRKARKPRKPRYPFFFGSTGTFTFDLSKGIKTKSEASDNNERNANLVRCW